MQISAIQNFGAVFKFARAHHLARATKLFSQYFFFLEKKRDRHKKTQIVLKRNGTRVLVMKN